MTPHRPSTPAELFGAYRAESGFKIAMGFQMEKELKDLCKVRIETTESGEPPWFTPADVVEVIKGIRAHLKNGTGGYTPKSLSPKRIFEFTQFQFLALEQRKAARRRTRKPRRDVPHTDALNVTRLVPEPEPEPLPLSAVVQQGFKALKEKLSGYTGEGTKQ